MDTTLDYRAAQAKFRPETIDVLWVVESPPKGGGYFYFPTRARRPFLFRETMVALRYWQPDDKPMHLGTEKKDYLEKFKADNHFLIDLSYVPVDKMDDTERDAILRGNVQRLKKQVKKLNPKRILLIKKNVHIILYPELKDQYNVLNEEMIEFPAFGNQKKFREKVRRYLVDSEKQPL